MISKRRAQMSTLLFCSEFAEKIFVWKLYLKYDTISLIIFYFFDIS